MIAAHMTDHMTTHTIQVVVICHDTPHYATNGGLSTNSISDGSVITGSSQPFSPGNLDSDDDHTPFSADLHLSLGDHVLTSITEDEYVPDDEQRLEDPDGAHHGSQDLHMLTTGASQDTELITGTWHGTSQQSSSHSQDPHSQDPNSHSDSGYAPDPTRSQESFPLKSQESFGHKSQDVFPPDLGYGVSNSGGSPPGGTGSQHNLVARRSNLKKDEDQHHKVGFGSPPNAQKSLTGTPTKTPPYGHPLGPSSTYQFPRGKGLDIPYGNRAGGYPPPLAGYQQGGSYHEHNKRLSSSSLEDSPYDNGPRLAHMEWRRAYPGGDYPYHHEMPMYGSLPPGGMLPRDPFHHKGSGRFSRPPEALMGHYPPKPKDSRMSRSMSHERMDQVPSYMTGPGGRPYNHEDYSGPMEYHLSQPSPYFDRPAGMFGMPPGSAHPQMMG